MAVPGPTYRLFQTKPIDEYKNDINARRYQVSADTEFNIGKNPQELSFQGRSMSGTEIYIGNCAPWAMYATGLISKDELLDFTKDFISTGNATSLGKYIPNFLGSLYLKKGDTDITFINYAVGLRNSEKIFTFNTNPITLFDVYDNMIQTIYTYLQTNLVVDNVTLISVLWETGGGHTTIVHKNKDGNIYILDPQRKSLGDRYYIEFKDYFKSYKIIYLEIYNTTSQLSDNSLKRPFYINRIYDTFYLTYDTTTTKLIEDTVKPLYTFVIMKDYEEKSININAMYDKKQLKNPYIRDYDGTQKSTWGPKGRPTIKTQQEMVTSDINNKNKFDLFDKYIRERKENIILQIKKGSLTIPVKKDEYFIDTGTGKSGFPDRDGFIYVINNDIENTYYSPISLEEQDTSDTITINYTNQFQKIKFDKGYQKPLYIHLLLIIAIIMLSKYDSSKYPYQNYKFLVEHFMRRINTASPEEFKKYYTPVQQLAVHIEKSEYNNIEKYIMELILKYKIPTLITQHITQTKFSMFRGVEDTTKELSIDKIPNTFVRNKMYGNCAIYSLYSLGMRSFDDAKTNTQCLMESAGPASVDIVKQFFDYFYGSFDITANGYNVPGTTVNGKEVFNAKDQLKEEFKNLPEGYFAPLFVFWGGGGVHMTTIAKLSLESIIPGKTNEAKLYIVDSQSEDIGYNLITPLDTYNFGITEFYTFTKKFNPNKEIKMDTNFRPIQTYIDAFPETLWRKILDEEKTNDVINKILKIYLTTIPYNFEIQHQILFKKDGEKLQIYRRGKEGTFSYKDGKKYLPIVGITNDKEVQDLQDLILRRNTFLKSIFSTFNTYMECNKLSTRIQQDGEFYVLRDLSNMSGGGYEYNDIEESSISIKDSNPYTRKSRSMRKRKTRRARR